MVRESGSEPMCQAPVPAESIREREKEGGLLGREEGEVVRWRKTASAMVERPVRGLFSWKLEVVPLGAGG